MNIRALVVALAAFTATFLPLPTAAALVPHAGIAVASDGELLALAAAEGWPGSGAPGDPIVISGYSFSALPSEFFPSALVSLWGTTLHVAVRGCSFAGLTSDLATGWTGVWAREAAHVEVSNSTFDRLTYAVDTGYQVGSIHLADNVARDVGWGFGDHAAPSATVIGNTVLRATGVAFHVSGKVVGNRAEDADVGFESSGDVRDNVALRSRLVGFRGGPDATVGGSFSGNRAEGGGGIGFELTHGRYVGNVAERNAAAGFSSSLPHAQVVLNGNVARENGAGIWIESLGEWAGHLTPPRLAGNEIRGNRIGIHVANVNSTDTTREDDFSNVLVGNEVGIRLDNATGLFGGISASGGRIGLVFGGSPGSVGVVDATIHASTDGIVFAEPAKIATVHDSRVHAGSRGIVVQASEFLGIGGVLVRNASQAGILARGGLSCGIGESDVQVPGAAVVLRETRGFYVAGNDALSGSVAVDMDGDIDADVSGALRATGCAIHADDTTGLRIHDASIEGSGHGACIEDSEILTLERSLVANSTGTGIRLLRTDEAIVRGNRVLGNAVGIDLDGATDSLVYDNELANGADGKDRRGARNAWAIAPVGGPNVVGGPSLGGNFWSGWPTPDANGDGFGDVPHGAPPELDALRAVADLPPFDPLPLVRPG